MIEADRQKQLIFAGLHTINCTSGLTSTLYHDKIRAKSDGEKPVKAPGPHPCEAPEATSRRAGDGGRPQAPPIAAPPFGGRFITALCGKEASDPEGPVPSGCGGGGGQEGVCVWPINRRFSYWTLAGSIPS